MKRKNDEVSIRRNIMFPLYTYTFVSMIYIVLVLFLPMTKSGNGGFIYGIFNFIIKFSLVSLAFVTNLRIRDMIRFDFPLIIITTFIKFIQIVTHYFLFTDNKLNFIIVGLFFMIEGIMTIIEYVDKKNFNYVYASEDEAK